MYHTWHLTLVMWPWLWKGFLCNLLACINSSFFKMDIVTPHYYIRLCNIESLSILDRWLWCFYHIRLSNTVSLGILDLWFLGCDFDNWNIIHVDSQLVLMSLHTWRPIVFIQLGVYNMSIIIRAYKVAVK